MIKKIINILKAVFRIKATQPKEFDINKLIGEWEVESIKTSNGTIKFNTEYRDYNYRKFSVGDFGVEVEHEPTGDTVIKGVIFPNGENSFVEMVSPFNIDGVQNADVYEVIWVVKGITKNKMRLTNNKSNRVFNFIRK